MTWVYILLTTDQVSNCQSKRKCDFFAVVKKLCPGRAKINYFISLEKFLFLFMNASITFITDNNKKLAM